ncbi:TPA: YtxH domain-containing protein [bacterium]|jgi:gas vesicle protein|nr:YtxH domain-containing protein [bacterium]
MDDKKEFGKMLVAFFAGGALGAMLGILFAPASGAETRNKIKDTSIAVKDKTVEKLEEAKEGAVGLFSKGKEKAGGVKSQIQAAFEAGKEAYKQKKEELTEEEEA